MGILKPRFMGFMRFMGWVQRFSAVRFKVRFIGL